MSNLSEPGLCASCRHVRTVCSQRGATFYLCGAAKDDPRLPKYPRLPVLSCPAYLLAPERARG